MRIIPDGATTVVILSSLWSGYWFNCLFSLDDVKPAVPESPNFCFYPEIWENVHIHNEMEQDV